MWKDKSRRNIGVDEFQLTSKKFIIHPEYGAEEGVGTHDICLIQTPEYEFGIFEDLSSKFESIPCLPETFDLEKVKKNYTNFLTSWTRKSIRMKFLGCIQISLSAFIRDMFRLSFLCPLRKYFSHRTYMTLWGNAPL